MSMNANISAFQQSNEENLLRQHAALVKKIALHLRAKLPDSVQTDDLIQAGMIGLLKAIKSYDGSKGAQFETYAGIRIRGAMLDEVRGSDWTPRSTSKHLRDITNAIHRAEIRLQRPPTDADIAEELDLPIEAYHKISSEVASVKLLSPDELNSPELNDFADIPSTERSPDEEIHESDLQKILTQAIEELPEKEQLVMSLYYDEEMNLKEIGAIIGVGESRVSQLHGQAVARLRDRVDILKNQ